MCTVKRVCRQVFLCITCPKGQAGWVGHIKCWSTSQATVWVCNKSSWSVSLESKSLTTHPKSLLPDTHIHTNTNYLYPHKFKCRKQKESDYQYDFPWRIIQNTVRIIIKYTERHLSSPHTHYWFSKLCVASASTTTRFTPARLIIWQLFQTAAMTHIFSVIQFDREKTLIHSFLSPSGDSMWQNFANQLCDVND